MAYPSDLLDPFYNHQYYSQELDRLQRDRMRDMQRQQALGIAMQGLGQLSPPLPAQPEPKPEPKPNKLLLLLED